MDIYVCVYTYMGFNLCLSLCEYIYVYIYIYIRIRKKHFYARCLKALRSNWQKIKVIHMQFRSKSRLCYE